MNTDIRVDVSFLDHWKTDTLTTECGAEGVLALMRLWIFAAQNKPDGRLTGVQTPMIERIAKWRGENGRLLNCLTETRFIEQDNEGVWLLHDWERHNPYAASAEWRHERAKKANAARRTNHEQLQANDKPATSALQANDKPATSALLERYKPAPAPAPAPAPSPSPFPSPTPSTPEAAAEPATEPTNDEDEKEKKGGDAVPVLKNGEKHTIAADWQPKPDTLAMIGQMGITAEFADSCLPQFRLWHQEQGTVRNGFESLFVGWVKKAWAERKPDAPPGGRRKGQTMAEQLQETHERLFGQDDIDPFSFRLIEGEAEHVH